MYFRKSHSLAQKHAKGNINRESTFDVLTHTERQRSSNIQILTSHHSPDVKKGFVKGEVLCFLGTNFITLHI